MPTTTRRPLRLSTRRQSPTERLQRLHPEHPRLSRPLSCATRVSCWADETTKSGPPLIVIFTFDSVSLSRGRCWNSGGNVIATATRPFFVDSIFSTAAICVFEEEEAKYYERYEAVQVLISQTFNLKERNGRAHLLGEKGQTLARLRPITKTDKEEHCPQLTRPSDQIEQTLETGNVDHRIARSLASAEAPPVPAHVDKEPEPVASRYAPVLMRKGPWCWIHDDPRPGLPLVVVLHVDGVSVFHGKCGAEHFNVSSTGARPFHAYQMTKDTMRCIDDARSEKRFSDFTDFIWQAHNLRVTRGKPRLLGAKGQLLATLRPLSPQEMAMHCPEGITN